MEKKTSVGVIARGILRHVSVVIALLFFATHVAAQSQRSNTDGMTPESLKPGAPAGSYPLSGFDSISPFTGSLNFRLPLLRVGGRGDDGYTIELPIEHHWRVLRMETGTVGFTWTPDPNWWSTIDPGFSPGTLLGRLTGIADIQPA